MGSVATSCAGAAVCFVGVDQPKLGALGGSENKLCDVLGAVGSGLSSEQRPSKRDGVG